MKVLHIQKVSGVGGSERHLLTLLPALAANGVEPVMCVLDAPGAGPFKQLVVDAGISLVEVPAGQDINPALAFRLRAEIRRQAPDLVHTHLIHADTHGQLAARSSGLPSVLSLHSAIFQYWSRPIQAALQAASRMSRGVIAISNYVAQTAARARVSAPTRTRVIYYGVDASGWELDQHQRARARAAFGWNESSFVVGAAARMIQLKGHDVLIDAFSQALPQLPSSLLALAGEGPTRADLEAQASTKLPRDQARFLGYVTDMRSFFNACDVVVFPTRRGLGEGFGLAALESMAAGRPTIATNVDALPEVIEDGVSGLLVEPDSPDDLAGRLISLAADAPLRDRLGRAASERAVTRFASDRMAEETLSAYEAALSGGAV